jgi:hypothetical protein
MKQRIKQLKRERSLALRELLRKECSNSSTPTSMASEINVSSKKAPMIWSFMNVNASNRHATAEWRTDGSLRLQRKVIEAKFSVGIARLLTHIQVSSVLTEET